MRSTQRKDIELMTAETDRQKPARVLFSSPGYRSYLLEFFRDCIGDDSWIMGADCNLLSPALYVADQFEILPKKLDEHYGKELLKICIENEIDLLVPLSDMELPLLSRLVSTFSAEGVTLLLSDRQIIDICFDKWKTYELLSANGIPVPRTFDCLDSAIKALDASHLELPIVIKPKTGSASRGIHYPESIEQLRMLMKPDSIIQEFVHGPEWGLDILLDLDGKFIAAFPRKKLAMRAGETDKAIALEEPELQAIGKKIGELLGSLGARGPLDVDLIIDGNDNPKVLEVNPRFGGGYPCAHFAGANYPALIMDMVAGKVAVPDPSSYVFGRTMLKTIGLHCLEGAK